MDYWDIEITNAISTLGEQLILDSCAATGEHCEKITRFTSGVLAGNSIDIDDSTTNVGGVDSSGYDVNFRYSTEIELGTLTFNSDTTYYDTYDIIQANGNVINQAGLYLPLDQGGHGNFVEWKSNLTARLTNDQWSASWAIRYIGEVDEGLDALGLELPAGSTRTVDSQTIHDVRFTYFMENLTTTLSVSNVFDEDPPYLANGFNDNTDPRTYNTTGRHISLSLGLAF